MHFSNKITFAQNYYSKFRITIVKICCYFYISGGRLALWWPGPVQGVPVPRLSPGISWDRLQHPRNPTKEKRWLIGLTDGWMVVGLFAALPGIWLTVDIGFFLQLIVAGSEPRRHSDNSLQVTPELSKVIPHVLLAEYRATGMGHLGFVERWMECEPCGNDATVLALNVSTVRYLSTGASSSYGPLTLTVSSLQHAWP